MSKSLILLSLVLAVVVVFTACGGQEGQGNVSQEDLVIFAASSLTDVVSDLAKAYQEVNPGVTVRLNFAGSKTLRTQLENGAGADLFLSANKGHVMDLVEEGVLIEGQALVANDMVVVVSSESEVDLESLGDLRKPQRLVLADLGVPAGDYGRQVLDKAGALYGETFSADVLANLVSAESNVRQVLMKVELGEADSALVYRTDAMTAEEGRVEVIDLPEAARVEGTYWLGRASEGALARDFLDYLLSSEAQEVFKTYGFSNVIQ